MAPVGPGSLQVVQAAIQVDDIGLLPDDPLLEVGEDVRAVAAILRRTDDDRPTFEAGGDPGGVAQAYRVADEYDPRDS
jgi:hypothetical protein